MEIEEFNSNEPICPHCKGRLVDWPDYRPDEGEEIEVEKCEHCGKPFTFSYSVTYYFTSKAEGE
jgi:hypothetical protein